ncbi:MAG: YihY family inner membrane protein [Sedimentisphaerales bacterium]|nr:YihY family inner membrane protein [Sedimentisphaerales bacterium]
MAFFSDLLTTPNTQLGRMGKLAVFHIKLWTHCARLLRFNRAGQQAAALSYRTIFGIIPLAIVMLLLFRLFPAYDDIGIKVKDLIYKELRLDTIYTTYDPNSNPELNQVVSDANNPVSPIMSYNDVNDTNIAAIDPNNSFLLTKKLDEIVEVFFVGVRKGTVTFVSLLIVIWAAIGMLSTIEKAFNNIWHVVKGRNFLQRIINYWALLTLGPILLGVGVYITTTNAAFTQLESSYSDIVPLILSYLISVVAFFMLYYILPNTKVCVKPAIWGAAVAALVWASAKWVFGIYVTRFIPYSQVYGMLGLIPLSVFWIYVSWLIVLFGLQLTFTTQHLKSLDAAAIASTKKSEEHFVANDITAINIVREIALAFQNNRAPVEAELISSKLDIPPELTDKILHAFVNQKIVVKTSEPQAGYVLAGDPENIRLSDISQALASIGFAQSIPENKDNLQEITQAGRNALARYNLKQILKTGTEEQNQL